MMYNILAIKNPSSFSPFNSHLWGLPIIFSRPHIAQRDPGREALLGAAHVGAVHVGPREGPGRHGAEPLVAWEIHGKSMGKSGRNPWEKMGDSGKNREKCHLFLWKRW